MKKLLLLLLMCSMNASHAMEQEPPKKIVPKEKKPLVEKKSKTGRWSKACLLSLLAVSGIGLVADSVTRAEADVLSNQVSPITAYPFVPGKGYPFLNDSDGLAQKLNCNYTAYFDTSAESMPPYKGECSCFRGFGCACTLETCPPAQEYKTHFYNQLGCNVTSICTRLAAFLGIGGWLMNKWGKI